MPSDDEAEASKRFIQSASVIFTEASSGRLYLAEACQTDADYSLTESAEVVATATTNAGRILWPASESEPIIMHNDEALERLRVVRGVGQS